MVIRKLSPAIIILFILFPVHAQEPLEKYSSELERINSNIPEDQIFIHTDRNLYSPGDTIFFQSYIQDRILQKVQTASKSLYVILQNPVNELIDSARFKINSSMAPGYLTLPDTVSPGYYRMLSYTSLMQNFDPKFCNTSWLRVDELKSEAVNTVFSFDKASYSPNDTAEVLIQLSDQQGHALKDEEFIYALAINDVPGDYFKVRSNNRGEATLTLAIPDSIDNYDVSIDIDLQKRNFSTRKKIPGNINKILLRFLPEGGTFTYGIKQRLAFNAVNRDGEQLYISGIVRNSKGEFIDSIISSELGPGTIEFTPIKGEQYYAEIQEYSDSGFDLPVPSDAMPVLRAECFDHSVSVQVSSPNAGSRNDFLVFRKNNEVLAFQEIDSIYKAFKFDTKKLPQGTASFLLLDELLNPVAERMVFINSEKKVLMHISSSANTYQPGEESEIRFTVTDTINTNAPAVFSVAVVDSVTGFYPNLLTPNIEESFLYDELFYKNLPRHIKFRGLSNIHQDELDILLLTYGWKKFTWQSTSDKNKEAERVYYDMLKVMIDDNLTKREAGKLNELENPFYLMSLEDLRVFEMTQIDKKNHFFLFDSLDRNANNVMVTPADEVLRYVSSGSIELPVNQDYYVSAVSSTTEPFLNSDEAFTIITDYDIITNRMRFIEEVSVTEARRKAPVYVNEYEKEYQNFSTQTLQKDDIEAAFDFVSLLRKLHPIKMDLGQQEIYLRYTKGVQLDPALFVLDGMPMETNYSLLSTIMLDEIHSITALRGTYGFQRYGYKAVGGVIFIETKRKHTGGEYTYEEPLPDRGDLGKAMNLFRPNIEFYIPDVKDISDNPQNWVRPTLFWSPELVFDGTNPVTIKYPNHLKKGTVLLKVNGVTEDSRPFYGEYRYEIK